VLAASHDLKSCSEANSVGRTTAETETRFKVVRWALHINRRLHTK
jgi:hypothetical protein